MAGALAAPQPRPSPRHALRRWATPQAQRVLASGYLGQILRFHRDIRAETTHAFALLRSDLAA